MWKGGDEEMPRIRIEWLSTRTQEQRQALVTKITEAFVEVVKVRPDQVNIVFEEIPPHLSAKGGVFWSEMLAEKK
jgi:phenylpyruvate tautomerase PptA (4-oxalocrotonate tautomerase family)